MKRRTEAADGADGPYPRAQTLLRIAAAGVLVVGAFVTVDAIRSTGRIVNDLNSDRYVKEARAFAANYRCLEARMADLQRSTPAAHLNASGVINQLSAYVLALAAVGTVDLRGPEPGLPTIVVQEDPTSVCGLKLTERTG